MKLTRLSTRIFIIILIVLVLPFTIMLFYVKYDMEEMLRDALSEKVIQNLSKSEIEVTQLFARMLNISSTFIYNSELSEVLADPAEEYWDRSVVFSDTISDISKQNLYDYMLDDIRITLLDTRADIYASWSMNYGDYRYQFSQDWATQSRYTNGFVVWSMSALGYEKNAEGYIPHNQISLARSIPDPRSHDRLGTLIVSVDQKKICDILSVYKYSENDTVFATTQNGEVLFSDGSGLLDSQLLELAALADNAKGNTVITLDGRRYLLIAHTIPKDKIMSRTEIRAYFLMDYERLYEQANQIVLRINIVCIAFALVVLIVAWLIAGRIAWPMRNLAQHMRRYRVGDPPIVVNKHRDDEIGEIYSAYSDMSLHINELFEKLAQEQITKEKYYYESLKSKISPHYLFNTLNSIRWMAIIRKATNIEESITALAGILEYSLAVDNETVALSRELSVIESYCHIQNVRFGNNCRVEKDIAPEVENALVIKFILQPTVENCFKYAFSDEQMDAVIRICARIENDNLIITISDNGKGFSAESIECFYKMRRANTLSAGDNGIGLHIIDKRIRVSYGDSYGIELSNMGCGGALITYRLPILFNEGDKPH